MHDRRTTARRVSATRPGKGSHVFWRPLLHAWGDARAATARAIDQPAQRLQIAVRWRSSKSGTAADSLCAAVVRC
jgi:hypothetical protein